VSLAKKEGFKNIGIDLIFGVWQETLKNWEKELRQACNLGISHISSYNLTYEKHTPLFKKLKSKEIYPLSEENVCTMYKYTMSYLPKHGFLQYEISNFAKKGFECKHNLNYWQNNSYLGLGPSAVSYCAGVRQRNIAGIKEYIAKVMQKENPVSFKEKLIPQKRARETAALKIRTKEGINFHWFRQKTGFDFMNLEKNATEFLHRQRLVKYLKNNNQAGGICLTEKGFLFCDSVCAELL
jgi:oxygen-independent coproporphyrinogen-3 oxidase